MSGFGLEFSIFGRKVSIKAEFNMGKEIPNPAQSPASSESDRLAHNAAKQRSRQGGRQQPEDIFNKVIIESNDFIYVLDHPEVPIV